MAESLELDRTLLKPGMRLAVAVSGGADSVALLRTVVDAAPEIGLVVSAAHMHHGIRGAEADADAEFVAELAAELGLVLHRKDVDAVTEAREQRETLEEAGRRLRYEWFRELLEAGLVDAVATAHTLDDQAETVLHRLLRGAWTEGLSGIYPLLKERRGVIVRPFLGVRRSEIEAWLSELGQSWKEDATNADMSYTRNRLRRELLPALGAFNPQICAQLANLATLARDEEAYWQGELMRILPHLLLPGRPVRGGGRSASTDGREAALALEIERLPASAAMRRRILRAAARELGASLNFEQTERLLAMCGPDGSRRQTLTGTLRAERTPRELRLVKSNEPRRDRRE
ncbi:MAG TPA: tRNA lysidine(34) synthetase TilS [Acidobacteriaceae bacterium]|nr:tRNA lysidine(34) synthetase TilS [Acidobacteriaceae bacterium]